MTIAKYKVLKECVIESKYHAVGDIYHQGKYMTLEALMALIDNGFIEKIKDEPWKPKEGEKYWTAYGDGDVGFCFWHEYEVTNQKCSDIGNCFQTKKQAEKAVEWLKAFRTLREDTKGFKPSWRDKRQDKWYVFYDYYAECLSHGWQNSESAHLIYFAEEADVIESIKKHPYEWKTFLGVEGVKWVCK